MNPTEIKDQVRIAFADVEGPHVGLRQTLAYTEYGGDDDTIEAVMEKAKKKDTEKHWWNLPLKKVVRTFGSGDAHDFLFYLPAALTAELESSDPAIGEKIFHALCITDPASGRYAPARTEDGYAQFLSEAHASIISGYYRFSSPQIDVLGKYFEWWTSSNHSYTHSEARPTDKAEREKFDEECRILTEWITRKTIASPLAPPEEIDWYAELPVRTLSWDEHIDLLTAAFYKPEENMREEVDWLERIPFKQQKINPMEWTYILKGPDKPIPPRDQLAQENENELKRTTYFFESEEERMRRYITQGRKDALEHSNF